MQATQTESIDLTSFESIDLTNLEQVAGGGRLGHLIKNAIKKVVTNPTFDEAAIAIGVALID